MHGLVNLKSSQRSGFLDVFSEKDRSLDSMLLHMFVDASENANGVVVYARCTYEDGSSSSEIVASKSRIAPCIPISIHQL